MRIILVLYFLFFLVSNFAQSDTLHTDSIVDIQTPKIFLKHISNNIDKLPKSKHIITYKAKNYFRDNFFLFILNLLLIAVFLLQISKEKIKKLTSTLVSINVLTQYSKVEDKRDNRYLFAYFLMVFFFIFILMYIIFKNLKIDVDIVYLSFLILLFFLIDYLVHQISSYLFNVKEVLSIIHFNNYAFIILLFPILIIAMLLILFNSYSVTILMTKIILVVFTVFYVWKEIRNIVILNANKINIFSFYFFLYLCTFKLIPIVVLMKIAINEVLKT